MRFVDVVRRLPRLGPFLLSHHPHCGYFRRDVFIVRGRRLCVSCVIGYPSIIIGLAAAIGAWSELGTDSRTLMLLGLPFLVPQSLSFAGLLRSPSQQSMVKLSVGLGIGLIVGGILLLPAALWKRAIILVLAMMAIQTLWLLRVFRLERTCRSCPQYLQRPHCEGLIDLTRRLAIPQTAPTTGSREVRH